MPFVFLDSPNSSVYLRVPIFKFSPCDSDKQLDLHELPFEVIVTYTYMYNTKNFKKFF